MTVKDLQEVLVHFRENQYRDYNVVFWDAVRQKKMDATFTGLSHPDREISFNVWDQNQPDVSPFGGIEGLPTELPSPWDEKDMAKLCKEDYSLMGVDCPRYFYVDSVGRQFTTKATDALTMNGYFRVKITEYRQKLTEAGISWS